MERERESFSKDFHVHPHDGDERGKEEKEDILSLLETKFSDSSELDKMKQSLIEELQLISTIKPGQTFSKISKTVVDHKSWSTSLWRTFYRENRRETITYIHTCLQQAVDIYIYQLHRGEDDQILRTYILMSLVGFNNMTKTYWEDFSSTTEIERIIRETTRRIDESSSLFLPTPTHSSQLLEVREEDTTSSLSSSSSSPDSEMPNNSSSPSPLSMVTTILDEEKKKVNVVHSPSDPEEMVQVSTPEDSSRSIERLSEDDHQEIIVYETTGNMIDRIIYESQDDEEDEEDIICNSSSSSSVIIENEEKEEEEEEEQKEVNNDDHLYSSLETLLQDHNEEKGEREEEDIIYNSSSSSPSSLSSSSFMIENEEKEEEEQQQKEDNNDDHPHLRPHSSLETLLLQDHDDEKEEGEKYPSHSPSSYPSSSSPSSSSPSSSPPSLPLSTEEDDFKKKSKNPSFSFGVEYKQVAIDVTDSRNDLDDLSSPPSSSFAKTKTPITRNQIPFSSRLKFTRKIGLSLLYPPSSQNIDDNNKIIESSGLSRSKSDKDLPEIENYFLGIRNRSVIEEEEDLLGLGETMMDLESGYGIDVGGGIGGLHRNNSYSMIEDLEKGPYHHHHHHHRWDGEKKKKQTQTQKTQEGFFSRIKRFINFVTQEEEDDDDDDKVEEV